LFTHADPPDLSDRNEAIPVPEPGAVESQKIRAIRASWEPEPVSFCRSMTQSSLCSAWLTVRNIPAKRRKMREAHARRRVHRRPASRHHHRAQMSIIAA